MSKSKTLTVAVNILDKEYQVTCPKEQEAELIQSAAHLDQQMRTVRENSKMVGLERVAVMAALNISHELLLSKQALAAAEEAESISPDDLDKLSSKIDEAVDTLHELG